MSPPGPPGPLGPLEPGPPAPPGRRGPGALAPFASAREPAPPPVLPPPLRELLRDGPPDEEAVAAFLQNNALPIVQGTRVTFVYRGAVAGVSLQHWIFGLASSQPFARIAGTDLWHLTLDLRRNSRVEYKFLVDYGTGVELVHDPFNPARAHDPFGSNSVCHTAGYEVPEWTFEDPEARRGQIVPHVIESAAFHDRRHVKVYLPARYRPSRRYPLLVVHDGSDYLRYSALQTVLDNLVHRLEIPPLVVALCDPVRRLTEYADDERHAAFLVGELLPALAALYPLVEKPSARGIMGASFGAVASLSAAWRHPGTFGNLLLQSGSFAFTDIGEHRRGPAFDPVVSFMNAFRDAPGTPAEKIYVSCGVYESLIYENRSLVPVLQSTGMAVRYEEARDGHNWENWRDRLRRGLSWLFPGPLWMVYE